MRIHVLDLKAFGPFSERRIDLSKGNQGLHIIYGPNEAGKSVALRALLSFFYGISERTTDDFLHDKSDLRIGVSLQHSDGSELALVRRKGRKNTLLDYDGKVVSEAVLNRFLSGVGAEVFANMFGLDHNALVQGGEQILKGSGDVGESLFAAGMGGIRLHDLLDELDGEAKGLYSDRAKNPLINSALSRYKEARSEIKSWSVSSKEWRDHDRALREAQEEERKLAETYMELDREKHQLHRLGQALPVISEREEVLRALEEQEHVILLSPDFATQRRAAMGSLKNAQGNEKKAATDLDRVGKKIKEIIVPDEWLEQEEAIAQIHERLGSHRKAVLEDMPQRKAEKEQLQEDAQVILRELRPGLQIEQAQEIRLTSLQRSAVQELGIEHKSTTERARNSDEKVSELKDDLSEIENELNEIETERDPSELRREVDRARKRGELESDLQDISERLRVEEEQAAVDVSKLTLWSGSLEQLEALPVPGLETADRFHDGFKESSNRLRDCDENIRKAGDQLEELDRRLKELYLAGSVPTEDDLEESRRKRNRLWGLVRRAWEKDEDVKEEVFALDSENELPEAYEGSVGKADDISDRLRREEGRVTILAQFLSQKEKLSGDIEGLNKSREFLAKEETGLLEDWSALWQPLDIMPLPPAEMRAWIDRHSNLVRQAAEIRKLRKQAEGVREVIEAHRSALSKIMEDLGEEGADQEESLDSLIDRGQEVLESILGAEKRRVQIKKDAEDLRKKLKKAEGMRKDAQTSVQEWKEKWAEAVKILNLGPDATPKQTMNVLNKSEELFGKIDKAASLEKRIKGMQEDAEKFEKDVRTIADKLAPDLSGLPAEQVAAQMNKKLKAALGDAAKLKELNEQSEGLRDAIETARTEIEIAEKELNELCKKAGCKEYDELEDKEHLSEAKRKNQKSLELLEDQLLSYCAGATIEQLLEEAQTVDPDGITSRIEEIDKQIKEIKENRDSLLESIGMEKKTLESMDGSARAAQAALDAQSIIAEIRDGTEKYVRLRLASIILRREIDRYREENQDPLIQRASELFSQLTLGFFSSLQTDFNERDNPVLLGERASGEKVRVDGMSDGTRDQLFLSLRLAALEKYIQNNEPIPLIADDLLINFDDQRAEATLSVLGTLSQKTQIIFFTHHSRLVDLAKKALDPEIALFTSLGSVQ